jgi:hypothetical protein
MFFLTDFRSKAQIASISSDQKLKYILNGEGSFCFPPRGIDHQSNLFE